MKNEQTPIEKLPALLVTPERFGHLVLETVIEYPQLYLVPPELPEDLVA